MLDRKFFYDTVRSPLFRGAMTPSQVEGIEAIFDEWDRRGLSNLHHLAYMLATTYHETDRAMQPVEEYGRGSGKKYGSYYGRGFVQLTWLRNYQLFGKRLGLDLENDPDLALRMDVAVDILFDGMMYGLFTGKKLIDYDFDSYEGAFEARAIVNGDKNFPTSTGFKRRGAMIASYHNAFLRGLKVAHEEAPAAPQAPAEAGVQAPPKTDTADPDYAAYLAQKSQQEREAANSKPLWQSLVARYVVAGVAGWVAIKFRIDIPPEYRDWAEGAVIAIMGAGSLYGRARATTYIRGVFRAKD